MLQETLRECTARGGGEGGGRQCTETSRHVTHIGITTGQTLGFAAREALRTSIALCSDVL